MATIRRYPLTPTALNELEKDFERLYYGLSQTATATVERAVQHAETYFNGHLFSETFGSTPGQQAVINTSTSVKTRGKYGAVGTLTATGKTEDTGFNILMAVEFGAGIAYNWFGGNPDYISLGMGVGTWPGQTHAYDFDGWMYMGKDGKLHHTYGTRAAMPMHKTILDMKAEMSMLITEEIKRWLF